MYVIASYVALSLQYGFRHYVEAGQTLWADTANIQFHGTLINSILDYFILMVYKSQALSGKKVDTNGKLRVEY